MATTDRIGGQKGSAGYKLPVYLASTGDLTLSGEQTIDGSTTNESRVLAKDQTTASENGIYVTDSGSWSRATDWDGSRDIVTGTIVYVTHGSVGGGNYYTVDTTGTIDIGTDNVSLSQFNTGLGAAGSFGSTLITTTSASSALDLLGFSSFTKDSTLLGSSDAAAFRTNIGAGTSSVASTQVDFFSLFIETPDNQDYPVAINSPKAFTVTSITTQTLSGTCTVTGVLDSTNLGGTANSASTTEQTQAHAADNAASTGSDFKLVVSSNASAADLMVTIGFTETL